MKQIDTQHTLSQFYEEFRNLPCSFKIEKVHQILNNPDAKATRKVNSHFKHLKLIIMTSAFIILFSSIFLWMNPFVQKTENVSIINGTDQFQEILTNNDSLLNIKNQNNFENKEIGNEEKVIQIRSYNKNQKGKTSSLKPATTETFENTIDGNKFILDLTFDELRNLGFFITHYSVFYHNSDVIFNSIHPTPFIGIGYHFDSVSQTHMANWVKKSLMLQYDTIPSNIKFYYLFAKRTKNAKWEYFPIEEHNFSFHPVFVSELDGTLFSLSQNSNFNKQNDTLVPVVVRFSQLNAGRKKDMLFWFTPTDEFFEKLPNRFSWLKQEMEEIKKFKNEYQDVNYVHYDIDKWVKEQLFTENIMDGKEFIVSLNDAEIEPLGCFREVDDGALIFNYNTIEKSISIRWDETDDSTITTYSDYIPEFLTLSDGDLPFRSRTSQQLDDFLIGNDITLPVLVNDTIYKDKWILWFSLSENFWKLIPERYQHLKAEYNKILFNKSFYPEKDLVRYFQKPFKTMDINVNMLQLEMDELEKLGFIFNDYKNPNINCALNKAWIQYGSDYYYPDDPGDVDYKSPNDENCARKYLDKYDSLLQEANKGYVFLGVTDTLGRVLQKIGTDFINDVMQDLNYNFLIPIKVKGNNNRNKSKYTLVFWFTPTNEFIERLPERYKTDLQNELNLLKSNISGSCTYFETCKSTLQLDNFILYPNPTKNFVTIEFDIHEATKGEITILTIAGAQLRTLVSNTSFISGHNVYQLDLSGISPGIYLISINTNEGFKTQRLIVSQ